jgi:hypothetical protein
MSFEHFVRAAKSAPRPDSPYTNPQKNTTQPNAQNNTNETENPTHTSSKIIEAIERRETKWETCPHLTNGPLNYCKKYMSKCAKEKCNPKNMIKENEETTSKRCYEIWKKAKKQ